MSAPDTRSSAGSGKAAPALVRLPAGARVGPYRISKLLGEGGMGTVYLAEHEMIARKAAIKILNAEVSSDGESVSRFFTEARAVNQIRHPNIVEVTDFGSFNARPYIVMEYLEGETLAERLARVRVLDVRTAVHIARQVASALGAAHGGGMVHRDLKPANIFLRDHPDYPDFVKVLDFGIAKLMSPGAVVGHQTAAGALIGTPAYMSPEQCLGETTLDHRSDIYSLGVVIYLALTGRLPFLGDTLGRLIMSHVNDPPVPPAMLTPQVSREMSAVILKSLGKKPQDRFATMKDFRDALDTVAGFERTPTPVVTAGVLPATGRPEPARARPVVEAPRTVAVAAAAPPSVAMSSAVANGLRDEAVFARLLGLVQERLVSGKLDLPQLSAATARCLQCLGTEEMAFGKLGTIVSEEKTLASRILRLSNSAAFASRSPATSIEQAIGRLGAQGLLTALVEFAAKPAVEGKGQKIKDTFRGPWSHALATGLICEKLFQSFGQPALASAGYLSGLLHDVGKPVVGEFLLAVERQTSGTRGAKWMTDEVWVRTVAATFRPVSVAVAKAWHLPSASVEAIEDAAAYRQDSGRSGGAVLRYALALAAREGYYLRRTDLEGIDLDIDAGRRHLQIDEKNELKLLQGLKQTVSMLAAIRGG